MEDVKENDKHHAEEYPGTEVLMSTCASYFSTFLLLSGHSCERKSNRGGRLKSSTARRRM